MRIPAFFQLAEVERHRLYFVRTLHILQIHHFQFLAATDNGYLPILQIDHLVRIFHNGGGIGCQEELIPADTYYQRAAFACGYNLVRILPIEHSNGIRTDHFLQSQLYGSQQVNAIRNLNVFDELYQHLGIGTTFKCIAFGLKFIFEDGVIFNDAVVDESEPFGRGIMRMGVNGTRFPMCSPACMCNANVTGNIFLSDESFQIRDLSFRLIDVQLPVVTD